MNDCIKFVILSMPRTGSSMLAYWLDTHPLVTCYPALFSKLGYNVPAMTDTLEYLRSTISSEWLEQSSRCAEPKRFLDDVFVNSPGKAVGFKQHLSGPEEITRMVIADPLIMKIWIDRPNHLATYSSNKIALETGSSTTFATSEIVRKRVEFIESEMNAHVLSRDRTAEKWSSLIDASGAIRITYPEAASRSSMDQIWKRLGFDPRQGKPSPTKRRQPCNILMRFTNSRDAQDWLDRHDKRHWSVENALPSMLLG